MGRTPGARGLAAHAVCSFAWMDAWLALTCGAACLAACNAGHCICMQQCLVALHPYGSVGFFARISIGGELGAVCSGGGQQPSFTPPSARGDQQEIRYIASCGGHSRSGTLSPISVWCAEHKWERRTGAGPLLAGMRIDVGFVTGKSAFMYVHWPHSILGPSNRLLGLFWVCLRISGCVGLSITRQLFAWRIDARFIVSSRSCVLRVCMPSHSVLTQVFRTSHDLVAPRGSSRPAGTVPATG